MDSPQIIETLKRAQTMHLYKKSHFIVVFYKKKKKNYIYKIVSTLNANKLHFLSDNFQNHHSKLKRNIEQLNTVVIILHSNLNQR